MIKQTFSCISMANTSALDAFTQAAHAALSNSIVQFEYPRTLRSRSGASAWKESVDDIINRNKRILDALSGRAGVYALLIARVNQEWSLKYVGQVAAKGCLARIKAHLVWRNKETLSGRYTGSRFDEVQSAVSRKMDVGLSFVELHPANLRQYIESYLIHKKQPEWNTHGTTELGQLTSRRHCCL